MTTAQLKSDNLVDKVYSDQLANILRQSQVLNKHQSFEDEN